MGWNPFSNVPSLSESKGTIKAEPLPASDTLTADDFRKHYEILEADPDLLFSTNRMVTGVTVAFLSGMILGGIHDAKWEGLRFRAEHAHRLPTSQVGWYLYHKSKNYVVMSAAVRGAVKNGTILSSWAGLFFGIEETLRVSRRRSDFLNTTIAGLCSGGCFSLLKRLDTRTTARNISMGIRVGLLTGIVTDLAGAVRGREIWYIERIKSQYLGQPQKAASIE